VRHGGVQRPAVAVALGQHTGPEPHLPRRCLADLTTADQCRYNQALASSPLTPLAAGNVRSTIGLLWRYRHHLDDSLTVDPRHAEGWSTPAGTVAENRTARIPEPVLAPLLAWALRFTDSFAPDILTAVRAREALQQRLAGPLLTRQSDILARLDTYLQQHLADATLLPGLHGSPTPTSSARRSAASAADCMLRRRPG
jgi:hypothetical protein